MSAPLFEAGELKSRVTGLQQRLAEEQYDGCVIMQRADLLYYTGAVFVGALCVPMFGTPRVFAWRAASRIGAECPAEVTTVGGFGQALRSLSESDFHVWKRIGRLLLYPAYCQLDGAPRWHQERDSSEWRCRSPHDGH